MNKEGSGFRVQGSGTVEQAFSRRSSSHAGEVGLGCSGLATVRFHIIHTYPALGHAEPRTLNPDHIGETK